MTTAHTPGPWEVVRHEHVDGEMWLSVNQHADAEGMKEWIAEIKYLTTAPDRQLANARLIAAAPELLAACKGVVDWFARLAHEQYRKTVLNQTLESASANWGSGIDPKSKLDHYPNWSSLGEETGPLDLQPIYKAIAKAEDKCGGTLIAEPPTL